MEATNILVIQVKYAGKICQETIFYDNEEELIKAYIKRYKKEFPKYYIIQVLKPYIMDKEEV